MKWEDKVKIKYYDQETFYDPFVYNISQSKNIKIIGQLQIIMPVVNIFCFALLD